MFPPIRMIPATACLAVWCLVGVVAHAETDPHLQLYIDFESHGPEEPPGTWVFPDRSQNGFRLLLNNFKLSLIQTKFWLALELSAPNSGEVLTDGAGIYARGEGVTVSIWVRLVGDGFIYPIAIGELRLYTRALSADEISSVMWKHSPLNVSHAANLAASWARLKRD